MEMVDITSKEETSREAIARGVVYLRRETIEMIRQNTLPKGEVLSAAQMAGIMAAKRTAELIPLCHPVPLDWVNTKFQIQENSIIIEAQVKGKAKTGYEMEVLTAVAVAALTVYDMCKTVDKDISVTDIRLVKKSGGKSNLQLSHLSDKSEL